MDKSLGCTVNDEVVNAMCEMSKYTKLLEFADIHEDTLRKIYLLGYTAHEYKDIEWSAVIIGYYDTENEKIIIDDLYVPEQENTTVTSEFRNDTWQLELYNILEEKRKTNPKIVIIGQIHSHNTMEPFFSSEDHGHVKEYVNLSLNVNQPLLFIVVSYKEFDFKLVEDNKLHFAYLIYSKQKYVNEPIKSNVRKSYINLATYSDVELYNQYKKLLNAKILPKFKVFQPIDYKNNWLFEKQELYSLSEFDYWDEDELFNYMDEDDCNELGYRYFDSKLIKGKNNNQVLYVKELASMFTSSDITELEAITTTMHYFSSVFYELNEINILDILHMLYGYKYFGYFTYKDKFISDKPNAVKLFTYLLNHIL